MVALTLFDIITLSIIMVSSLLGLYRGFLHILINLLGFIASVVVAIILYPYVSIIFVGHIESELGILILSGALAYIVSLIFFTFLTSKILLLLKDHTGGIFDRVMGLIAGFVRGGVFSMIIFMTIAIFTTGIYLKVESLHEAIFKLKQKEYPVWLKDSFSAKHYEDLTKGGASLIPPALLKSVKMPGSEKDEEDRKDEDIIDLIKKKKNKDGVSSSVDIQIDEDLEKGIKELDF